MNNTMQILLRKVLHLLVVIAVIGMTLGITSAKIAYAAAFTVTKTADTNDGVCDADCSLREAIRAANAQAGDDTIILPSGIYILTIPGADENMAVTGDLDIASTMTISGASATSTIIDGGGIDRVFDITGAFTGTISNVTIRGGNPGIAAGGGLQNQGGVLIISNSVIISNTANSGGGIYSYGTLIIANSTFSSNIADNGGGIYVNDFVTITASTFSNNSASGGYGGGIANISGVVTINNSAIISNTAGTSGGGIYSFHFMSLTIVNVNNSTISGNTAGTDGGGIANFFSSTVNLNNVTVTNNTSDKDSNGTGDGGGLFQSGGTANLENTLVGGNADTGGPSPDCSGTLNSQGYNLIQNTTGCTINGDITGNITGVSPNLGPLQDNGGPTFTHALLPGSPVIDAGNPAAPGSGGNACEATDQRGVARPQGAWCDMGAYEATPTTYTASGRVIDNSSTPLAGVTVGAGAGGSLSATTNASGYYTITGLIAGTYTLTPTKSGYTFSPPPRMVGVPPNATGQNFTGTLLTYSISGRVADGSNNSISGVTISDGAGHTATTDSSGNYTLSGLAAGSYTLTPTKSDYTFSPSSRTVSVPPNMTGQDFTGTQTVRTPIVFIPGLMGSRLFNTIDGQEKEVWVDPAKLINTGGVADHPLMVLELGPDGVSPARDEPAYTSIHTKPMTPGIVTKVNIPLWFDEHIYDVLIDHYAQNGYTENVDFWVYPYDWRKDLKIIARDLDKLITQTGASQVYIVAHSLGGLVAREYISDPTRAERVKRAVIVGTPFLGTPESFYSLLEGGCISKPLWGAICLPPNKQVVKALVTNYPSFYQIMPSEAYFTVKGGGFYALDDKVDVTGKCPSPSCLSFNKTYVASIASNLNQELATKAYQFHSSLDAPSSWNGVPVDIVGGVYGNETIAGVRQYSRYSWEFRQEVTIREPRVTSQGDGTVTLLSVKMANDATGVDIRGDASFTTFPYKHGDLVKKPDALAYIDNLLGIGATQLSVQATSSVSDVTGAQIVAYGVTAIHTYDSSENHTGPITETDFTEQAIPGSAYFEDQDMATVAMIGGQTYTITVMPSGFGPVDITLVRSTITETLTSTLYLGISVTNQSRIRLVGDPYSTDTWRLDVDGSGTNIQLVLPTTVYTAGASIDSIPPTMTITLEGTQGPSGWYVSPVTVTLNASDNVTGTGISRVEYGFSNDRQVRLYSGPFVVKPEEVGILYVKAVDRAGNEQFPISQVRIGPERIYLPIVLK